jgi:sec-independent protein translocase protein TatA
MVPLFPGVPGGPELVVLLLIILLLGLPLLLLVVAAALGVKLLGGDDGESAPDATATRLDELERRVETLERERRDDGHERDGG